MSDDPEAMKRVSLSLWIFLGMAVGILLGLAVPAFAVKLAPVSNVFLRLIKSIIAPLLFGTLVSGIAGTGSVKAMGRIGVKAIVYFEIVTTIALIIGLVAVNVARPGEGMKIERTADESSLPQVKTDIATLLEHTFPTSIIDAMARGEVLQIVVFSFLFGAACASIGTAARPVTEFAASLAEAMFRYTRIVMYFAPFGVAAAMAVTVGSKGVGVLFGLGKLILTAFVAQAFFVIFVLGAVIALFRIPLRPFIAAVREPFLIAFSTAASEAALPRALENMERFGVPKHIVAFVLPTGYSFNLDGTTLYLSLASIFVAQAAGIHMPLNQQIMMMLTLMLTSKGVAGVPRAALVILAGTLASFHLPAEGASVLLGIDAIMDMARTSVNVLGNCLATAVVARWEGFEVGKIFSDGSAPQAIVEVPAE
ncbi:MAG TPA: cation:dicarboxylase symporter family transporter [Bryobacteraceae bacterium]|nr:cation:dicarboxylase symporter family transporter [Bryobacteraceae bacterium]